LADEKLIPKFQFREREWENWNHLEDTIDTPLLQSICIENALDYAHIDFVHDVKL
jgi:hypothetical protein